MTLSEFSLQIRIVGKLVGLMAVVLLFFYFLIMILIMSLKKPATQMTNINPTFGKITAPIFEEAKTAGKLEYQLDTIDGKYPETTPSARVYFIPEPKSTLAYLTKVESLAQTFGFDTIVSKPQQLDDQWVKYEDTDKILEVNIKSYYFKFKYKPGPYLQSIIEATPSAKFTLYEGSYLEKARQTMIVRDAYPVQLATGSTNPVYELYNLVENSFRPVKSGEYPQAIRLDFFRVDQELKIAPPNGNYESQNYVLLAPLTDAPQVIEAQYISYSKLETDPGTYPLLTSEEAFAKLKAGKATVISAGEGSTSKIKIKKIELGYYDPLSYQPYFQPIFIFMGNDNFIAYMPAIKDEYLTTKLSSK